MPLTKYLCFAAKLQTEEITDQRISEYLDTTCTRHPTLEDYPEPANKCLHVVQDLLLDFEQSKAKFHGDNSPGTEWWRQECATLESRLTGLMATIFRMRGLHVVTRIVHEDNINDESGEHPWQLCFTCSCTQWIQNGFCICVQMVGSWYDWGWPGADVEDVCLPLPANKKRGRPKKAAPALHRQPPDNDPVVPGGANNVNPTNLQTRWRDNIFMHVDTAEEPERDGTGGAVYQKEYGPHGTRNDNASFKQSFETGQGIQVKQLKEFLKFAGARVSGTKPELQARLADVVDMDSLFDEGCPGPWAPNFGTEISRQKTHVSAIVAGWSDARMFDEFLAWGYDLPLLAWSLAKHSPVRKVTYHNYDLENDWPRTLVENWDDIKDTAWQDAVDKVMPTVREFAVARIADWIRSGDWGGWAACQPAGLVDCVKGCGASVVAC